MWKIKRIIILFFALMLAINLTIAGSVAAETIYVDDDGTADFTTIQAALDSASPGDEIVVNSSTYTENVDVDKANITIRSNSGNPFDTIVQAASSADHVFHVTADGVKISGFNITGAIGTARAGIYLEGVEYCLIKNNTASNNSRGIVLSYQSNYNKLENNTASDNDLGIYLNSSSSNTLENNTASDNLLGILLDSSSSNTLENNTVSDSDYGIELYSSSNSNTLFLNDLLNNSVQICKEGSNLWNSPEPVDYLYNGERQTSYLGNYYSDYSGPDADENGIGDTAYEYDSYPLLASSDNYILLAFDSEAPVINSVEFSPTSLYAGESLLVTVNSTDNVDVFSVEASGISLTCTGGDIWQGSLVAEEGTHPVNVSAADAWGDVAWDNSSSYSAVAKPKHPSSSGSSGRGGGGGGGSPEPASNIEIKELSQQFVTNRNPARFDFPEGVTCVCYVAFDAKRTFGRTFTTAEMLKGKSALVEKLPAGIVYKNVNIWVGNEGVASPKNIGNAVIGFRVEKQWLESNGVNENAVLLYRYSDGEWSTLVTSVTGNDENFVYFEAKTPDYSPFAIVASRVEITEKEDSAVSKITRSALEEKAGGSTPETSEGGEEKAPDFGAGFALAGILCALCILKKSRKHD